MKNVYLGAALALVVGAGAGFFGGMQFQKSKTPTRSGGNGTFAFGRNGGQGGGNRNGGFRPTAGQIISVDDKSITVKLMDGSSKIILLSNSTMINKATTATKSDLAVGQTVAVFGQTNTDGSVTAQNIQLNPQQFRMMGNVTPTP